MTFNFVPIETVTVVILEGGRVFSCVLLNLIRVKKIIYRNLYIFFKDVLILNLMVAYYSFNCRLIKNQLFRASQCCFKCFMVV